MNIQNMHHTELLEKFGKLVQSERRITALVLEFIAEIDVRKIYLEQAYPSLFNYLVEKYGYSPSAAARRIHGAKLLREVPQISEQINSGALNLSQVSLVHQAIKTHQETTNEKLSAEIKTELLSQIAGTTQAQTELILAQSLNVAPKLHIKPVIHRDESVTITITFSKEELLWAQKARDVVSHSVPGQEWNKVFAYLSQKEVKRKFGAQAAV